MTKKVIIFCDDDSFFSRLAINHIDERGNLVLEMSETEKENEVLFSADKAGVEEIIAALQDSIKDYPKLVKEVGNE